MKLANNYLFGNLIKIEEEETPNPSISITKLLKINTKYNQFIISKCDDIEFEMTEK